MKPTKTLTINGVQHELVDEVARNQINSLSVSDISGLSDAIASANKVKTVAGKSPSDDGNVELCAVDVGARPDTWTPTAEEISAATTDHTHTPESLGAANVDHAHTAEEIVYENSTSVKQAVSSLKNDLSAEQTARVEGLAEKLGKTETAANSAKLGGYEPEYYLQPRNLLDNSDFTNPVNQRGQSTYIANYAYTIDRWILEGSTCWIVENSFVSIEANSYLVQRIHNSVVNAAKTYTLAVKDSAGNIYVGDDAGAIYTDDGTYGFWSIKLKGRELVWAALYEGAYTAETLPPYVPKGYAVELSECRMYFQPDLYIRSASIDQWNVYANSVTFPVPMRTSEYNVVFRGLTNGTVGVCEMYKDGVWNEVACGVNDRSKSYLSVVCPNGGLTEGCPVRFRFDIIDDL